MNLILFERDEAGAEIVLHDHRAAHIRSVLRASPGDHLRVGVIDGPMGSAVVQAIDDEAVRLSCTFDPTGLPMPAVDLLLALPRPKVLRRLWPQLAALGVRRILLTNAERVERHYFDTHVITPECYRPLLVEGLQQARDTRVPQVTVHRRFKVLIEDELDTLIGPSTRLVADPSGEARIVSAVTGGERVLLAVGPEGGWNAFELELLKAHGFTAVSMGARTLRTDTACVALLALVHDALSRT